MIVDSSAVLAVLLDEADAPSFLLALSTAPHLEISSASWLETVMVMDRKGDPRTKARLATLFAEFHVSVADFTAEQAALARVAWSRYGTGSGHRAQLNFGDCMAYALAKQRGEPLLFKGNDFARADVASALAT